MQRHIILAYGVLAYLAFFAVILYAIGFVAGAVVPKHIDSPGLAAGGSAALIDLALLMLFAVTHSSMARPAFKNKLIKVIPAAAERSTFVLVASLQLGLAFVFWQSLPQPIWNLQENPYLSICLRAISICGWVLVFWSSFQINHFDLFGLRQTWLNFKNIEYTQLNFTARGLYKYVRHPLMLGFLLAFWSTPSMSVGHLLFCMLMTGYIFAGVMLEERDLRMHLGEEYKKYQESTSMIFPWTKRK